MHGLIMLPNFESGTLAPERRRGLSRILQACSELLGFPEAGP